MARQRLRQQLLLWYLFPGYSESKIPVEGMVGHNLGSEHLTDNLRKEIRFLEPRKDSPPRSKKGLFDYVCFRVPVATKKNQLTWGSWTLLLWVSCANAFVNYKLWFNVRVLSTGRSSTAQTVRRRMS